MASMAAGESGPRSGWLKMGLWAAILSRAAGEPKR